MALHPALPEVIEIGVVGEALHDQLRVCQVDAPGVFGEEFLDIEAVLDGELAGFGHSDLRAWP